MELARILKRGMSGEDVLYFKQKLLESGFYADHITTVTRKTYGSDTAEAVKRFQAQAGLAVDGIVGEETWAALFGEETIQAQPVVKAKTSELAKAICTLALTRVGDLYVWGASGMDDLSDARIRTKDDEADRAIKFRNSQYKYGFTDLLAHDCSGFISWLYRQTGAWGSTGDSRRDCDGLWGHCSEIQRSELIPGDLLFRVSSDNPSDETHVGLYVGSGKVIHAKGRDVGVVLEGINRGGSGYWHKCGRCRLLYE